jgi:hypothetical protein
MGWGTSCRGLVDSSRHAFMRSAGRVGLAICLISGGVALLAEPASAAPGWTLATSPTPAGTPLSLFSGVACAGTSVCFSVGQFTFDFQRTQSVIKRWNGTTWTLANAPNPAGATSTTLTGVKCQSVTSCFAVGNYHTLTAVKTLILRWTPTSGWAVMTSANPGGTVNDIGLNGIACPSATSCYAVGSYDNGVAVRTLVEHWNGTNWAIQVSPTGTGAIDSNLTGIACPALTTCIAVGEFQISSGAQKTLVLRYNGTAWAVAASPNPSGTLAGFNGVACYSPTGCIAVGGYSTATADLTLVERWNGSAWAIMASPNASGTSSVLRGVACATATNCQAAGESVTTVEKTLIERFNGTSWAVLASPGAAGTTDNNLNGIACAGTTFCLAAGGSAAASGLNTLVERWNNTAWAVVATPGLASTGYGLLNGVACPSATLCVGVGQFNTGFQTRTTSVKLDTSVSPNWKTVTPKIPTGATSSKLLSIACPSITLCLAVGTYTTSTGDKTLAEKFNGTAWSIVTTTNVTGAESNVLAGVACPTSTSCFAVGSYVKAGVTKTLAEHWNGTALATQTSINPSGADPVRLQGISCPSATSCFAVGNFDTASDERALVEHWNGTAWAQMATPTITAAGLIDLNAVSCPSISLCYAAGSQTIGGTTSTLIETWSGTWSIMTSANPGGATDSELNGISCPTTLACFATGRSDTASGNVTLEESLSGTTWTIDSTPNGLNTTGSELNAVTCQSDVSCVAVGDNQVVGNRRSLILRYG